MSARNDLLTVNGRYRRLLYIGFKATEQYRPVEPLGTHSLTQQTSVQIIGSAVVKECCHILDLALSIDDAVPVVREPCQIGKELAPLVIRKPRDINVEKGAPVEGFYPFPKFGTGIALQIMGPAPLHRSKLFFHTTPVCEEYNVHLFFPSEFVTVVGQLRTIVDLPELLDHGLIEHLIHGAAH